MTTVIGIKELHANLGRIARRVKRGERVLVVKHREPMFMLTPYKDVAFERGTYRHTLADLRKLQTKGGDKNISKKIDALVYGV